MISLRKIALPLCVLGFLWFTLINHLRIEWTVNPQYGYGWAVPFLCAFLIWKRITTQREEARGKGQAVTPNSSPIAHHLSPIAHLPPSIFHLLFVCLAIAWLPTRLIQEANPEWRLVSWALAIEVVGLTLLIWELGVGSWELEVGSSESSSIFPFRSSIFHIRSPRLVFPLLFFLIAVPWPTLIEGPLVQFLTRTNAATTVEVVGWFGIPALLRGNIIEVGTGMVGFDDACSGIRSFQATLMISLFLGELFRLAIRRRLVLVLGGCLLAYVFNVARTSTLVWIASGKGVAAMTHWHDPTGVTILVADFICLWLAAMAMRRVGFQPASVGGVSAASHHDSEAAGQRSETEDGKAEMGDRGSEVTHHASRITSGLSSIVALAAWLAFVDVGTELWYRSHEALLAKTVSWRVEFPRDNPTFRAIPFSDVTKQFLRYDEGLNSVWVEAGAKLQAIFLRWNPGRIAPHLAKSHTPEVCLTAAGHEIISKSDLHPVTVHGLQMPFRSYVVKDEHGPVHVFYCLWEDRTDEQSFSTTSLNYANRLGPVLAGRRNSGQRSLEIALWGMGDSTEADAALARELEKLIKIQN